MDKQIIYAGDPLCAWCYGFGEVFETVRETFGDRVRFSMIMGGLRVTSSIPVCEKIKTLLRDNWSAVVRRTGQAIALDRIDELPEGDYNSEPPCRAVVAVRTVNPDLAFSYYAALHRAFYLSMKNINDPDCLAEEAQHLGIDPKTFFDLFHDEAVIEETRRDFENARQAGVLGYPALILKDATQNRVLNQGYQPLERILSGIDAWLTGGALSPFY
jgi:putative protein-disulfide isomerase